MRRRHPVGTVGDPTPPRLRVFDPADWPLGCHPECAFWAARQAWLDTLTEDELADLDPVTEGPDTPWHDEDG